MNLLTPDEVAAILKINPRTVVRWLQMGKLPGIELKKGTVTQWRVDNDDLHEYIVTLKRKWAMSANYSGS